MTNSVTGSVRPTVTSIDVDNADLLLTTTRAVRKRLDLERPVEPQVLLECLRVAGQAPSGGNGQRWRWMLVRDAARKAAIGELYGSAYAEYIAPRRAVVAPDDRASLRMIESSTYLAEHMAEVPVLVIPCLLDRVDPDASAERLASFYGGVFPAIWSFQLALRSRGLGSALTTLHLDHEAEVADILGMPSSVTQAALLPVAYYTGDTFRPAARRPVEEITYWDAWKDTTP